MLISGPTKSGKTELTKQIVLNASRLIHPTPLTIFWCYSEWQEAYKNIPCVFIEGVPDLAMLKDTKGNKLVILDDLMDTIKAKDLNTVFVKGAHHWNMSVIHITQNPFYGGMRTARINTHYMLLLKNPSDKLQIKTLANQMYPGQQQFFFDAFTDATSKPFGYLLVDMEPTTDDRLRLRTNIFDHPLVYVYK